MRRMQVCGGTASCSSDISAMRFENIGAITWKLVGVVHFANPPQLPIREDGHVANVGRRNDG